MTRYLYLVIISYSQIEFLKKELEKHMLTPRVGFSGDPPIDESTRINITITLDSQGPIHQNTVESLMKHFHAEVKGEPSPTDDLTIGQKMKRYLKRKILEAVVLYIGTIVFLEAVCSMYSQHVVDIITTPPFTNMINETQIHQTVQNFQFLGYYNYLIIFALAAIPSVVHLVYGYLASKITESSESPTINNSTITKKSPV